MLCEGKRGGLIEGEYTGRRTKFSGRTGEENGLVFIKGRRVHYPTTETIKIKITGKRGVIRGKKSGLQFSREGRYVRGYQFERLEGGGGGVAGKRVNRQPQGWEMF